MAWVRTRARAACLGLMLTQASPSLGTAGQSLVAVLDIPGPGYVIIEVASYRLL